MSKCQLAEVCVNCEGTGCFMCGGFGVINVKRERTNHVCSECGAYVSDEFYDRGSGLCDICLKYED